MMHVNPEAVLEDQCKSTGLIIILEAAFCNYTRVGDQRGGETTARQMARVTTGVLHVY